MFSSTNRTLNYTKQMLYWKRSR